MDRHSGRHHKTLRQVLAY